eukprot:CAMPEP_0202962648 /NCGR_PEP_ID=MMETSP1396-20130829/6750_1 /ASSEMBLY_ACC=CAM_ASM_000872 /TAXON_ID= /ORGANISM="Pseudokeronopsis sp., Strain Brazil" /LENGTH=291 /DNA_ID=CAMNT_0049683375 /DNA_START=59 /DNA_END=934 /DNA_ORIENTATION=-
MNVQNQSNCRIPDASNDCHTLYCKAENKESFSSNEESDELLATYLSDPLLLEALMGEDDGDCSSFDSVFETDHSSDSENHYQSDHDGLIGSIPMRTTERNYGCNYFMSTPPVNDVESMHYVVERDECDLRNSMSLKRKLGEFEVDCCVDPDCKYACYERSYSSESDQHFSASSSIDSDYALDEDWEQILPTMLNDLLDTAPANQSSCPRLTKGQIRFRESMRRETEEQRRQRRIRDAARHRVAYQKKKLAKQLLQNSSVSEGLTMRHKQPSLKDLAGERKYSSLPYSEVRQ